MRSRNGIPIDISRLRKPVPKVKVQKQNEFHKYNIYVTMFKHEDGHNVWTMVPLMHPDFQKLKNDGYRITEKWDKREVTA